jgi:hypothetical protein
MVAARTQPRCWRAREESVSGEAGKKTVFDRVMGDELEWGYMVRYQLFVAVIFSASMVPGAPTAAGLLVCSAGQLWLVYHVVKKARRQWRDARRA